MFACPNCKRLTFTPKQVLWDEFAHGYITCSACGVHFHRTWTWWQRLIPALPFVLIYVPAITFFWRAETQEFNWVTLFTCGVLSFMSYRLIPLQRFTPQRPQPC